MIIYHYCSTENFINIIKSRTIWLSDLSMSNDTMEGVWTKDLFLRICSDKKISRHHIPHISSLIDTAMQFVKWGGFCFSEAEEGDLLSQWRGYADNGNGISIGFSTDYLESLCHKLYEREFPLSLNRIIYTTDSQYGCALKHFAEIDKLISDGALDYINKSLLSFSNGKPKEQQKNSYALLTHALLGMVMDCKALKNPAFSEEREWRITTPFFDQTVKNIIASQDIKYRSSPNRVIPYCEVPLLDIDGAHAITRVVIGPQNITSPTTIKDALKWCGFQNVSIARSSASYRP